MSQVTAGDAERKAVALVAKDGYSYGFTFGQDGTWNDPPMCDFCGKEYESIGVQINMDCGLEICPDCFLSGPKAVASKVRSLHREEACGKEQMDFLLDAAGVIGRLDSFTQLPRGIVARKIAEAYREAGKEV